MKKLTASLAAIATVATLAACSDSGDAGDGKAQAISASESTAQAADQSSEKPEPTRRSETVESESPAEEAAETSETAETAEREPSRDCTTITAEEALHEAVAKMPPYRDSLPDWVWSDDFYPDYHARSFDSCAALTGMPVIIDRGTGSSPVQVALFHYGEYLGTATSEAYMKAKVEQLSDDTVQVTWNFLQGDEAAAFASGRAVATFTWDDAQGKVVMEGDVPPSN